MQMSSKGQVQRSAAQGSEIIARYRQSGMGSRQFCEQEGLRLGTFETWYSRLRRGEPNKGKFIEVQSSVGAGGPWAVEVEFPTGVRLRMRG
jgi:hypothetical protein